MDSTDLERCLQNLGASYDQLVTKQIIPDLPLQTLYENSHSLEIEPERGLELSFWPETKRLEMIQITISNMTGEDSPVYSGSLPEPYTGATTQANVRAIFGQPLQFHKILKLPNVTFTLGDLDSYQIATSLHEGAFVDFQYTEDLRVHRIIFSLIGRN